VGKRSRKRRGDGSARAAAPAKPQRRGPEMKPWPERPSVTRAKNAEARATMSRSELKNAEARAKLKPLAPGERPRAVTVGAVVTAIAAAVNLVLYLGGQEIQGQRPALAGIIGFTGLMLVMAWGLWKAKYWAVLGLMALLGIIVLFMSLFALRAENVKSVLIVLAFVIPSGTLFWFLVRALARIQMPERPGAR
jgi:ABC-type multidrug transport system permease subunit